MVKVMLAVDDSEFSQKAVEWYLRELHKEGNEVIVFHLQEFPFCPVQPVRADILDGMFDTSRQRGEATIEMYQKRLAEAGIVPKTHFDFSHKLAEDCVKFAKEENVSYIAMGTRGLGKVRRTILGSISDYILHHAHCPVCICKQDHH